MEFTVTKVLQTTDVLQLEKCVNDHDGIELKVAADYVGENDFAVYDGSKLIGYLQAFAYLPTEWEVNVFVDPDYRQQGIFKSLVETAAGVARETGAEAFTFVIDDASQSGKAVLGKLGAEYRMTEYNMVLKKAQLFLKADPDFELREATASDRPFIVETLGQSFGNTADEAEAIYQAIETEDRVTYVGVANGQPVGVVRAYLASETQASIHAFAVRPEAQGNGYGKKMLKLMVQAMFRTGRTQLELDVETDNARALDLYKDAGFVVGRGYQFHVLEL
ncbi:MULTISPECIES: GNAT family N-acetyltransferase [Exiguobacterium]|uniref:N-acetyltransferase n=1 Tax=Exiguobacterium oxidotolerans TaxID=223958 RepID=A0A653I9S7_9BACL|nr:MULTISPECIES: GNAT family N-acetyltransferase [Exiguobacterium]ASI36280.1 N-acetyltransferase [Exiguobacterium sp. N4-1P]VWX35889.1 N-acetyltransferase [Exiguobacterium oxidotolerans]